MNFSANHTVWKSLKSPRRIPKRLFSAISNMEICLSLLLWNRRKIYHIFIIQFWLQKSQRPGSHISPPISMINRFSVCNCIHARGRNFYPTDTLVKIQFKFEDGLCRSQSSWNTFFKNFKNLIKIVISPNLTYIGEVKLHIQWKFEQCRFHR